MNRLPKLVVSTTLTEPLAWSNSRLLTGELAEAIAALKSQPTREDARAAGRKRMIASASAAYRPARQSEFGCPVDGTPRWCPYRSMA